MDLAAKGAINGVQRNGTAISSSGVALVSWGASTINLSDADPSRIPGIETPSASRSSLDSPSSPSANQNPIAFFLTPIDGFDISGNQPLDQGILSEHGGAISIFIIAM